jgi:hypothetical protein
MNCREEMGYKGSQAEVYDNQTAYVEASALVEKR